MMQEIAGGLEAQNAKYILSYGGGVNTTALMVLLVRNRMPLDEAVFADTGGELPETYENIRFARSYLGQHGIPLTIVRSKAGTLYDTCVRRKVVPSMIWRWSTRDYKVGPIHAHYRSLDAHVFEYLGIAYDEVERMKESREDYITNLFPLIDRKLTREDCIKIIQDAGVPMPVKSGCYFCPFNNLDRWEFISKEHPRLYAKAMRLEENSKHFPDQRLSRSGALRELKESRFGESAEAMMSEAPCGGYCTS